MKGMLLSVGWRNVRDEWKEMHEKPKLSMIKRITECAETRAWLSGLGTGDDDLKCHRVLPCYRSISH